MVHVQSDAQPTLIVVAAAVGRVATAVRVARGYAASPAAAGGGSTARGLSPRERALVAVRFGSVRLRIARRTCAGPAGWCGTRRIGRGRWCAMRVRGRRWRINGEQGSEAQPGRPARRRGRGVPRGDLDGAGQAVMPAVRRDADPDKGRRWSGTAIPCRTCCSSTATRRK